MRRRTDLKVKRIKNHKVISLEMLRFWNIIPEYWWNNIPEKKNGILLEYISNIKVFEHFERGNILLGTGIFSRKPISKTNVGENDIKEYLEIRRFLEEKEKAAYKPPKEKKHLLELAPVSCAVIVTMTVVSACAVITMKYIPQIMICDDAAGIAIKLLNPTWLYNHRKRLGADAAGINVRDLEKKYEKDYLKRDKYISQRLLAALYQNQVNDTTGALIYSVGRMRNSEYINELEEQNADLKERVDILEIKLDEALSTASDATARERIAVEQEQMAREEARHHKKLKEIAEEQRDRAIREFEIEMVGKAITDQEREQEKVAQNQRRLENMSQELLVAAGITEKEVFNSFEPREPVVEREQTGTITEAQRKDILYKLNNGYKQKELAEMYGVSQGTISKIKRKAG